MLKKWGTAWRNKKITFTRNESNLLYLHIVYNKIYKMPYEIRKVSKGWKVFTKGTDRSHSNDPLPLSRAKNQLKALYANNADEDAKMRGGMIGGFDDGDWNKLFGVYGGADDDDDDAQAKEDSEAIVRLDKDEKSFDVEDATGEPEYLKLAKQFAKKAGYKDAASLKLANDGKHKLMLRGVKFGSINNNDYIIYRQHFPSIAEQKRKQYLARARKIKGDWAKNKYSPNSLAINILWDGSNKKGGFDWAGLASDFVKDAAAAAPGFIIDNFGTEEAREKKRQVDEACKVCKEGYGMSGGEKKMNFRKDGDDPRNWGYDEDVYIGLDGKPISKDEYQEQFKSPVEPEYPEQPQFVGDPTQFQPQPYDPTNPLMYMVGGAVPINKKLYERVKAEIYPLYKKPSAYRSGAVVKRYKDLGGKFKDSEEGRPLARWFKEEWKDVGNWGKANFGALPPYPVYRPTKRISKDTPLTPEEIDPENLQLQIEEKQKIRGDSNLKPFKGGRLAQTDVEETKVAKQILNKVAGEANAAVREISETPMSDSNIRRYFPNAKVLKYSELADVEDITTLLPQPKSFFFLLYEQSFNSGHFVSVNRYIDNGRDTICFFCSYGSKIDAPLRWNSPEKNRELGQGEPYLTELLRKSGKYIQYNRVQYQSKTSPKATCGAFATLWLKANIRDNMNLQDFHDWITEIKNETGLTYDAIAANAVSQRD